MHNGDDGCAFIFVDCMKRCGVGRVRTIGLFVLVCVNVCNGVVLGMMYEQNVRLF